MADLHFWSCLSLLVAWLTSAASEIFYSCLVAHITQTAPVLVKFPRPSPILNLLLQLIQTFERFDAVCLRVDPSAASLGPVAQRRPWSWFPWFNWPRHSLSSVFLLQIRIRSVYFLSFFQNLISLHRHLDSPGLPRLRALTPVRTLPSTLDRSRRHLLLPLFLLLAFAIPFKRQDLLCFVLERANLGLDLLDVLQKLGIVLLVFVFGD